jgi:uncharacterized protein YutE (UPF0331/DUF86 family)
MPIMQPDAICLNKAAIIERCIRRMREEYESDPDLESFTHLDALVLNIERACQATIDLAMHVVAQSRLGIPQSSAEAFVLSEKARIIPQEQAVRMSKMVGFRNIAIHQYQDIDTGIIHHVMLHGINDFIAFACTLGLHITDRAPKTAEYRPDTSSLGTRHDKSL